jgi:lipoprotein-releasing system permease protein
MFTFIQLLTHRYLIASVHQQRLNYMVYFAIIGIAVSSFALALVLVIMSGFEKATHAKLKSIHPDLIMHAPDNQSLLVEDIQKVFATEFPQIEACSPFEERPALILQKEGSLPLIIMLKGIDPVQEEKVSHLNTKIVYPISKSLETLINGNHILIGARLAAQLKVKRGDELTLWHPDYTDESKHITLHSTEARIGGIFRTGIEEYDTNCIFCTLPFLMECYPDAEVSHLSIRTATTPSPTLITALKKRFEVEVMSWQEMYSAIVAALLLEKYASFLVLCLLALVAAIMVMSLLFMFMENKKRDIAILRAMGASIGSIQLVFGWIAGILIISGSFIGLTCAYVVGYALKYWIKIRLPDAYLVSYLPIDLQLPYFFIVFGTIILISSCVLLLPLLQIRSINIVDQLRID